MLVFSLLLVGGNMAAVFYIIFIKRRLARDAADREQSERREQTRNHVLELLAHGAPLTAILEAIVRGVEQEQPDMLCSIMLLDNEGKHLFTGAAPGLARFLQCRDRRNRDRHRCRFLWHRSLYRPACHR